MRFQFTWVAERYPDPITETYNEPDVVDQATAEKSASAMIAGYNQGEVLRYGPGNKGVRQIVSVKFLGDDDEKQHDWEKVNLVTRMGDGHGARDKWRCKVCGCEALRYGVSSTFKRIGEWRSSRFKHCPGDHE